MANAEGTRMNKYTCTMMGIGDIYYVTLIAESEQQAREMAMAETKRADMRAARGIGASVSSKTDVDGSGAHSRCREPGSLGPGSVPPRSLGRFAPGELTFPARLLSLWP